MGLIRVRLSVLQLGLVVASGLLSPACGKETPASLPLDAIPDKVDSKWMQCQSDTHCVVSFGPCGEWVAVNREFVKVQQAWAVKKGRVLSCPEHKTNEPKVRCREQACVTLP